MIPKPLSPLFVPVLLLTACTPISTPDAIRHVLKPVEAAPASHNTLWRSSEILPGSGGRTDHADTMQAPSLRSVDRPRIEEGKVYDLSSLVDFGLRANPATRGAWEQARSAAAGLGIAEAAWLPVITAGGHAGYYRYPFSEQRGAFSLGGTAIDPVVGLSWTLFDRARPANIDKAGQQLLAANFALNRTHQQVVYNIQRSFYALLAARAHVLAQEKTLEQASQNVASVRAMLARGLATNPEVLLAIQDQAHAGFELQSARGQVMTSEADLAESLGTTPDRTLKTVSMDDLALPKLIESGADAVIDQALLQRPDLAERLARLRSQEAEIRSREATWWPVVSLTSHGGWKQWNYRDLSSKNSPDVSIGSPKLDAFITFDWNLFEGFSGVNRIDQAKANLNAAQAEYDALQLKIIRDVWRTYADLKTAVRKVEFAAAMLNASEKSWEAAHATFAQGLCTVVELLTAERNLAQARATDIDSRSGLLKATAELIYAAGGDDGAERSRDLR